MSVWRQAEEILNAIQNDLDQEPPTWESAVRSTENLRNLVPAFPKFQNFDEGQALQKPDMQFARLRADLGNLHEELTKRDREAAVRSASAALRSVQELRRKET